MLFTATKIRWLVVALTLLMVSSMVGAIDAQPAKPTNISTFTYDTFNQQITLDPVWAFNWPSFMVIEQLYEPLTFYKGSSTTELIPIIAATLPTVSADGLTYTYSIRNGITFHNGDPLTPADVQYTFLRSLITDRAGGSGFLFLPELLGTGSTRDGTGKLKTELIDQICGYNGMKQAVTVNGNEVTFHLTHAFAPFQQVVSGAQSDIVDKKFIADHGGWPGCTGNRDTDEANFQKYNNPPNESKTALFDIENGSGPFMLQKWDKVAKITTMVAYPNYWQGDPSQNGSFRTLIFKEISGPSSFGPRLLDLKNGQADVIDLGAPSNLLSVHSISGARSVEKLPTLGINSFFFNFDIKQPGGSNTLIGSGKLDGNGIPPDFFRDIHIRKALNYLFDNDLFLSRAYNGFAVTPATPNIQGLPFFNPEQPGVSEAAGIKDFEKDHALQKAADEFKLAFGGTLNNPGPVWTNGFAFTILYPSGNQARQIAANILQAGLLALNSPKFGAHGAFNIVVRNVLAAQMLDQLVRGTMPMFGLGWYPDYIDPADFVPQWMGSSAVGGFFSGPSSIDKLPAWGKGGTTPGGIAYKNWDDLLNKGLIETDPSKRKDIYYTLQKLFVDNAVALTLSQPEGQFVERSWLNGYRYNPADPGLRFSELYNPVAGIKYSKAADGNGSDDIKTICTSYPKTIFVLGGAKPTATDCSGKAVPVP